MLLRKARIGMYDKADELSQPLVLEQMEKINFAWSAPQQSQEDEQCLKLEVLVHGDLDNDSDENFSVQEEVDRWNAAAVFNIGRVQTHPEKLLAPRRLPQFSDLEGADLYSTGFLERQANKFVAGINKHAKGAMSTLQPSAVVAKATKATETITKAPGFMYNKTRQGMDVAATRVNKLGAKFNRLQTGDGEAIKEDVSSTAEQNSEQADSKRAIETREVILEVEEGRATVEGTMENEGPDDDEDDPRRTTIAGREGEHAILDAAAEGESVASSVPDSTSRMQRLQIPDATAVVPRRNKPTIAGSEQSVPTAPILETLPSQHRHRIRERALIRDTGRVTYNLRREEFSVSTVVNGGTREVVVYPWILFRNFKNDDLFVAPGLHRWRRHHLHRRRSSARSPLLDHAEERNLGTRTTVMQHVLSTSEDGDTEESTSSESSGAIEVSEDEDAHALAVGGSPPGSPDSKSRGSLFMSPPKTPGAISGGSPFSLGGTNVAKTDAKNNQQAMRRLTARMDPSAMNLKASGGKNKKNKSNRVPSKKKSQRPPSTSAPLAISGTTSPTAAAQAHQHEHRRGHVLGADWVPAGGSAAFSTQKKPAGNVGLALSLAMTGDIYRQDQSNWSYPMVIPHRPERSFFRKVSANVMEDPYLGLLKKYHINRWPLSLQAPKRPTAGGAGTSTGGPTEAGDTTSRRHHHHKHNHAHSHKHNLYLQKSYIFRHPNCPLRPDATYRTASEWDVTKMCLSYDQRLECWVVDAVDAVIEAPFWLENHTDRPLYVKELLLKEDTDEPDEEDMPDGSLGQLQSGLNDFTKAATNLIGIGASAMGGGGAPESGGNSRGGGGANLPQQAIKESLSRGGRTGIWMNNEANATLNKRSAAFNPQGRISVASTAAGGPPVQSAELADNAAGGLWGRARAMQQAKQMDKSNPHFRRRTLNDAPLGTELPRRLHGVGEPVPFAFHQPHQIKDPRSYEAHVQRTNGQVENNTSGRVQTSAAHTSGKAVVTFRDSETNGWISIDIPVLPYVRDKELYKDTGGTLTYSVLKTPPDRSRIHAQVAARMANQGAAASAGSNGYSASSFVDPYSPLSHVGNARGGISDGTAKVNPSVRSHPPAPPDSSNKPARGASRPSGGKSTKASESYGYPVLFNRTIIFKFVKHKQVRRSANIANKASTFADIAMQAKTSVMLPKITARLPVKMHAKTLFQSIARRAASLAKTNQSVIGAQTDDLEAYATSPERQNKGARLVSTATGGTNGAQMQDGTGGNGGAQAGPNATTGTRRGSGAQKMLNRFASHVFQIQRGKTNSLKGGGQPAFHRQMTTKIARSAGQSAKVGTGAFKNIVRKTQQMRTSMDPTQMLQAFVTKLQDRRQRLLHVHALGDAIARARNDQTYRQFIARLDESYLKQIVYLAGVGFSMNDAAPREIGYLFIERIQVENRSYDIAHLRDRRLTHQLQRQIEHHERMSRLSEQDPHDAAIQQHQHVDTASPIGSSKGNKQDGAAASTATGAPSSSERAGGAVALSSDIDRFTGEVLAHDPQKTYPLGSQNWALTVGALQFDTYHGATKRNVICVRSPILEQAGAASRLWMQNALNRRRARDEEKRRKKLTRLARKNAATGAKRKTLQAGAPDEVPLSPPGATSAPQIDPRLTVAHNNMASPGSAVGRSSPLTAGRLSLQSQSQSPGSSIPAAPRASANNVYIANQQTVHKERSSEQERLGEVDKQHTLGGEILSQVVSAPGKVARVVLPDFIQRNLNPFPTKNKTQEQDLWMRRLAERSGSLLTVAAAMRYQGSIVCLESFHVHTNRLILNIDSGSIYNILRFGTALGQSLSSDFMALQSSSALKLRGGGLDPDLSEPSVATTDGSLTSFPTPLFITKFYMSKIKLVISVRFSGAEEVRGMASYNDSEIMKAYESVAKALFLVDIQDTPFALGALSGSGVAAIEMADKFLTKGSEDLQAKIGSSIFASILFQSIMILGTPSAFGNIPQIGRAFVNGFGIVLVSIGHIATVVRHPQLPILSKFKLILYQIAQVLRRAIAAFFLVIRSGNNSATGIGLSIQKGLSRICLGARVRLPSAVTNINQSSGVGTISLNVYHAVKYSALWYVARTIYAWYDSLERAWYKGSTANWLYFVAQFFSLGPRMFVSVFAGAVLTIAKMGIINEIVLGYLVTAFSPLMSRLIKDPPEQLRRLHCFKGGQLQNYDSLACGALEVVRKECRDVDRRFWTVCPLSKATFVILETGAMYYCRRHGRTKGRRILDGSHNYILDRSEQSAQPPGANVANKSSSELRRFLNRQEGKKPVLGGGLASPISPKSPATRGEDNLSEAGSAAGVEKRKCCSCKSSCCSSGANRRKLRRRAHLQQQHGTQIVWRLADTFRVHRVALLQKDPSIVLFEGVDTKKRRSKRGTHLLPCETEEDALVLFSHVLEHLGPINALRQSNPHQS
ncbi:unnamed protein product [Amoebophrya sp. A120]|nr:unnamed protein product [Amoebophrya sp. A120]|eukprot:GSA120T00005296001.1